MSSVATDFSKLALITRLYCKFFSTKNLTPKKMKQEEAVYWYSYLLQKKTVNRKLQSLASASERTDEVDGVSDALLPLAGNLHRSVVVVDDNEGGRCQLQFIFLLEIFRRLKWPSSVWHGRAAGVSWSAFIRIVQGTRLFKNEETKSVVSVSFWQDEWEQEVKNDISVVNAIAGNIGNKPVPKLR